MDLTMKKVMDYQQAEHFYKWLESKWLPEDQHIAEERVHASLREDPTLMERGFGWTEIMERTPESEVS
jgi:hypothetical protein